MSTDQKTFMERLLGPSWKSTLWGWVTLSSFAVSINPSLVEFLPETWQKNIRGIAGIISFLTGAKFAMLVKDNRVSGTPATGMAIENKDGDVRILPPEPPKP